MSAPAVPPLHGAQMAAVAPEDTVWLTASAGTGKTHVLAARVLRLLLEPGVAPSQILCLTFTKAGAAEMAGRINDRLAGWVRADPIRLAGELRAIGAPFGAKSLERARTLFAAVLDCPGGGLRIDTIHAFAQWLLGAFPEEARLAPGTRAIEDAERDALARAVLADLLSAAATEPLGDPQLIAAASDLSLRHGPAAVEAYLLRCAAARAAWFGPGGWQEPMRPRVNQLLGLPADADAGLVAAACADDAFDVAALRACLEANNAWARASGIKAVEAIGDWLLGTPEQRAGDLAALTGVLFTQEDKPRFVEALRKCDPDYAAHAEAVRGCVARAREAAALLALADRLVPALRLGRAFALAWEAAKRREGLIDFDDQIRLAADLLADPAYGAWIGYKLDRRFDHILVDEAQDTNAAQWDIIAALTQDFFAGSGQHGARVRTLFVVGDTKQAIFGFQGTSPANFEAARARVAAEMAGAAAAARAAPPPRPRARALRDYGLDRSFRSAQRVLDFVDDTLAGIGPENLGLRNTRVSHRGEQRPGYVALWRPVASADDAGGGGDVYVARDDDDPQAADEPGDEGWLSRGDRRMADRVARQVKAWLDPAGGGFALVKGAPSGTPRRAGAGDVMVLVRQRRELASLIVARLHAAGVPVAGVDRLRLAGPLAVRDLIAALKFAVQPLDDLNLACLLVSPLIGWSQEQLLEHGWRDETARLWTHLRRGTHPEVVEALERLGALLRRADFEPPRALLHWLLVGPWQGRRRLVARLGREADDPIDELLNQAGAFAARATPSLVGFVTAFEAGEVELKREAGGAGDLVRVMTVHAAKGLQAPIVILADAAGDPDRGGPRALDLPDAFTPARAIPLPPLGKAERVGRVRAAREAADAAERQEHWRLFYVAMTRAEEALFLGGALARNETEPAADSWFARARRRFGADDWVADPIWGDRLDWGEPPAPLPPPRAAGGAPPLDEPLPRWTERAPAAEPRPPRPLAPSALGEDDSADPPYPPGARGDAGAWAARRGVLVHRLLERLPQAAPDARAALGARWLARAAADVAAPARAELLADALAVLADPRWAELFGPDALAEAPIAALAGDRVVSGTIDRLLIGPDRIRLVDFKTARRPPATISEVPQAVMRQMAAYALALAAAYPGRAVEAALLYTAAPRLIALPDAALAPHKRALLRAE